MGTRLADFITKDEGKTLEFKRDLSSPDSVIRTVVAFANSSGGILVIGVEDRTRAILGIDAPLDQEERLANLIHDRIEPKLVPTIEMLASDGRTLLIVEVYPSPSRPHWVKRAGPDTGVYVRLGSTNRRADHDLIEELRRGALGLVFDEQPLPDHGPDDIDVPAAVALFGDRREISRPDLETLRVFTRHQRRLVPTVGGFLLFGRQRLKLFPDAWVQCGRFAGRDRRDILDHTEIETHLPEAVDRTMDFLKKHAMRSADRTQIRRKDVWNIPLRLLREGVVNALVHADYSQKGAPIRVSFFDDRIEIENPGILLPGLTMEDIRGGVSRLRNHVIGRVFRELGLIEQWGSGIGLMFAEADKEALPVPRLEEIGMRFRLTVFLAHEIPAPGTMSGERLGAGEGTKSALSRHQVVVLDECVNEASVTELLRSTGRSDRTKFRNAVLNPLLEKGLLEMTIPDKPRSSKQRYRLTDRGRLLLKEQERNDGGVS